MNKILIAWNLILTALVIMLMFKLKSNMVSSTGASLANVVSQAQIDSLPQGSIVYVNTDSLMENYQYVKDLKSELEKEKNVKENAFQTKVKAFEQQVASFKEIAQRLSPEEGQRQQMELMQKEQKLNEYREQLSTELIKKEQDKTIMMQQSIQSYIKTLNSNGKYNYVLGYSNGGGILFANTNYDITKIVTEGLNNNYKATK